MGCRELGYEIASKKEVLGPKNRVFEVSCGF